VTAALERYAAQAVAAASLFERVVHHDGPWQICVGGRWIVLAQKATRLSPDASELRVCAEFGPEDGIPPGPALAELFCQGELVAAREVEVPGEDSFEVCWAFPVPVEVLA
jgi:hypothetical protein